MFLGKVTDKRDTGPMGPAKRLSREATIRKNAIAQAKAAKKKGK